MKTHTTNYENTLIEVADDCPADAGQVPPLRGNKKSVANYQYEMLIDKPYQYTSDDVLFAVFAQRKGFETEQLEEERRKFFSKGQPCFRASPLTKRYGWGVHSDDQGRIALYGRESEAYQRFSEDAKVTTVKAMKSKR